MKNKTLIEEVEFAVNNAAGIIKESSYIEGEFSKLAEDGLFNLRVTDDQGNKTNTFNLNAEELQRLKSFLSNLDNYKD